MTDFADVAATGIEDVVERAFRSSSPVSLGPAFDHAHGLGVKGIAAPTQQGSLDVFGESSDGFKQTALPAAQRITIGSKASSTG